MDFDADRKICKAVALVSQSQIYQKRLFVFLCIIWSQIAYNSLINPMVLTNPLLSCYNKKSSQAYYCSSNKLQNTNCKYLNDFTGTYRANLYCQNRDYRMTLQSIFAFGTVTGNFVMPIISDLKGKSLSFGLSILCCLGGYVLIFFGIYYQVYLSLGIGMFTSAFGSIAMVPISFSLNSDFFSDDLRQKAVIYYCAAWGLTDMSVLIVYYLVPYWWFFIFFLLIVPMTCLFIYFRAFFLESPHYLINAQSDYQQAKTIIRKLAQINKSDSQSLKLALQTLTQLEMHRPSVKKQELTFKQASRIIFLTPKYLKAVICLVFIKMAYYSFYYGVQGSLERTGFNFGVSAFLLGSGQFTGYMTGSMFIPKIKRRLSLGTTSILTSLIGISFVSQYVQQSPIFSSIILYICFTLSSYSYSAISLIQTQSFSSKIRSTAVGLQFGLAYFVRMAIPFVIGFLNEKSIQPIIVASFLIIIIGILPTYVIRQTLGYSNIQQPLLVTKQHKNQQIELLTKNPNKQLQRLQSF